MHLGFEADLSSQPCFSSCNTSPSFLGSVRKSPCVEREGDSISAAYSLLLGQLYASNCGHKAIGRHPLLHSKQWVRLEQEARRGSQSSTCTWTRGMGIRVPRAFVLLMLGHWIWALNAGGPGMYCSTLLGYPSGWHHFRLQQPTPSLGFLPRVTTGKLSIESK